MTGRLPECLKWLYESCTPSRAGWGIGGGAQWTGCTYMSIAGTQYKLQSELQSVDKFFIIICNIFDDHQMG